MNALLTILSRLHLLDRQPFPTATTALFGEFVCVFCESDIMLYNIHTQSCCFFLNVYLGEVTFAPGKHEQKSGSMLSSLPSNSIDKSGYFTSQNMGVAGPQPPHFVSLCHFGCCKVLDRIHKRHTTQNSPNEAAVAQQLPYSEVK